MGAHGGAREPGNRLGCGIRSRWLKAWQVGGIGCRIRGMGRRIDERAARFEAWDAEFDRRDMESEECDVLARIQGVGETR